MINRAKSYSKDRHIQTGEISAKIH